MVFALLAAFAVRVAAVFVLAFHCNGRSVAVIQQKVAFLGHLPGQGFRETCHSFAPSKVRFRAEVQKKARKAPGLSCGSGEHCQLGDSADGPAWPCIIHSATSQISPSKPLHIGRGDLGSLVPPWLPITKGKRCYNLHLPPPPPSEAFPVVNEGPGGTCPLQGSPWFPTLSTAPAPAPHRTQWVPG